MFYTLTVTRCTGRLHHVMNNESFFPSQTQQIAERVCLDTYVDRCLPLGSVDLQRTPSLVSHSYAQWCTSWWRETERRRWTGWRRIQKGDKDESVPDFDLIVDVVYQRTVEKKNVNFIRDLVQCEEQDNDQHGFNDVHLDSQQAGKVVASGDVSAKHLRSSSFGHRNVSVTTDEHTERQYERY